jgi:hypothetical protein
VRRGGARHTQVPESTQLEAVQSLLDGPYPIELSLSPLVSNGMLHPGPGSWRETGLRTYVALAGIDRSVHVDLVQDFMVLVDRGVERRQIRIISELTNESRSWNVPQILLDKTTERRVVIRIGLSGGTYAMTRVR